MADDFIVNFETWQAKDGKPKERTLFAFISRYCAKNEIPVPPISALKGEVEAFINQGRWVVGCPVRGCGNAVMASYQEPYFFCHACGNADNPDHWYRVIFPEDREEIEKVLLERKSQNPFNAPHRNWIPGEDVAYLRWENAEHGIVGKA